MRFIPTRIHGILDYMVGAFLVAMPWIFGFARGGAETWVPVVLGAGAILYSLVTSYELGLVHWLPMPIHLNLDLLSGVVLAASPWTFAFSEYIWAPHLILGLFEVAAALMTKTTPSSVSGPSGQNEEPASGHAGRPPDILKEEKRYEA